MLCAFIFCQGIERLSVRGVMLVVLGLIDVAVIYLTVLEWRYRRLSDQ